MKTNKTVDMFFVKSVPFVLILAVLFCSYFIFNNRVKRDLYFGTFDNLSAPALKALSPVKFNKKILVLEATSTAKYFNKTKNEQLSAMWINFLTQSNVSGEVVTQDEFINTNLDVYDILILPFALCLSDGEIEKINRFAASGEKGLILDGFTGARDGKGNWRDISYLSKIMGGCSFKELKEEEKGGGTAHIIFDGTGSLFKDIEPGFRLEVNTYNRPLAANISENDPEIDGYWESTPVIYENKLSAGETGMAHGNYFKARFVWLGFLMGSVTGNPLDQAACRKLIDDILNYVSFRPQIYIDRWPKGERAAAIFAQDTEDRFQNALNTVSLLRKKDISATFFCVPELASEYDKVFAAIYSRDKFEIGLHGVEVYRGQSLEMQTERLKKGRSILESLSGRKVRGFRPPEAIYDDNTLRALQTLNYVYMAGDDLKQAGPEIIPFQKQRSSGEKQKLFVKFPKTGNDDYDLLERYKMQDKTKMLELLKRDFDSIYKIGGLYYYSFHTQLMAEEKYIDVISKFIDYVKGKDVWIASFSEARDWALKRSAGAEISSVQTGAGRTTVKITNNSENTVEEVKINLLLPSSRKISKAYLEKSGEILPYFEGKDGTVIFEIQSIKSSGNIIFEIEYGER